MYSKKAGGEMTVLNCNSDKVHINFFNVIKYMLFIKRKRGGGLPPLRIVFVLVKR